MEPNLAQWKVEREILPYPYVLFLYSEGYLLVKTALFVREGVSHSPVCCFQRKGANKCVSDIGYIVQIHGAKLKDFKKFFFSFLPQKNGLHSPTEVEYSSISHASLIKAACSNI